VTGVPLPPVAGVSPPAAGEGRGPPLKPDRSGEEQRAPLGGVRLGKTGPCECVVVVVGRERDRGQGTVTTTHHVSKEAVVSLCVAVTYLLAALLPTMTH
jgi:hypothetical protein